MIIQIAFGHDSTSVHTLNKNILNEHKSQLEKILGTKLENTHQHNNLKNEIIKLEKYQTYLGKDIHYYRICGYIIYTTSNFLNMLHPLDIYDVNIFETIVENIAEINNHEYSKNLMNEFILTVQELSYDKCIKIKKKAFDDLIENDIHFLNIIKYKYLDSKR